MNSLHERLKEERVRLGFTQEEFAEKGGVKRRAQAHYESGERCPDGHYFSLIAEIGADVLYIVTGIRTTPQTTTLSPREAALLDNYRHVDDELDKKVIERTAFLAAKADEHEATERKRA